MAKALYALCEACTLRGEPYVATTPGNGCGMGVLGAAPGRDEVKQGVNFVGPSGRILNNVLEWHDVPREDLFVANAVACKTPNNREPTPEELECCWPRLQYELTESGVARLLTLGRTARDAMLPHLSLLSATATRGMWYPCGKSRQILPSWHPAYILRGQEDAIYDLAADVWKFANIAPEPFRYPEYWVLSSLRELQAAIDEMLAAEQPIGIDAETTNIDMQRSAPNEFWDGYILCLGFHYKPHQAYIVPEELFNRRPALAILRKLFEAPHGLYGHNVKYDFNYAHRYYDTIGEPLKEGHIADDTMLMHYVLNEVGALSLKEQSKFRLNAPDWEGILHRYLKKPEVESYSHVPRGVLYRYLACDITTTVQLRSMYEKELRKQGLYDSPYRNVLIPSVNELQRAEYAGMPVLEEQVDKVAAMMLQSTEDARVALQQEAAKVGVEDVNPNSPKQLAVVFYDKLGFPPQRGRKIKPRSTNKEVLAKWKAMYKGQPILDALSTYRYWWKRYKTYALGIPKNMDHNGHAHFSFNLAGTETGRITGGIALTMPRATKPEGKMLRDCFGLAEASGRVLMEADYSQAELRWAGWYAQEPFLFQVYADDRDLHTEVALAMFGPDWTKEDRMMTKMFNFSYLYGGTEYSFAADAGLPIAQARAFVKKYKANMPKLDAWHKCLMEQLRTRGWLQTPTGRRRRFLLLTAKNWHAAQNEAKNFPVQSISNDAAMLGMCKAAQQLRAMNLDAHLILHLHDGSYWNCAKDVIAPVANVLRSSFMWSAQYIMEVLASRIDEFADLEPMPFRVDAKVGPSWGSMREYKR